MHSFTTSNWKDAPTPWFYQPQVRGCSNTLVDQLQLEKHSNTLVLLALTKRMLQQPTHA